MVTIPRTNRASTACFGARQMPGELNAKDVELDNCESKPIETNSYLQINHQNPPVIYYIQKIYK
jgi:hypothetical protein